MKIIRLFLFVLIIIGVVMLFTQKFWVPQLVDKIIKFENGCCSNTKVVLEQTGKSAPSVSISVKDIKEDNFSGKVAVVSGTSQLAIQMQKYIDEAVATFRKEANDNVPAMREKFGVDSPPATYTIDINSKYIKSEKTESVMTEMYSYTGGAHGSTIYKVITGDFSNRRILSLSDIIKQDRQNDFTKFVKKQLNDWRPEGGNEPVVFKEDVESLTFDSFSNWSLDDEKLIIYFDQYKIGPSVLGAVAFPLLLEKINDFLQ